MSTGLNPLFVRGLLCVLPHVSYSVTVGRRYERIVVTVLLIYAPRYFVLCSGRAVPCPGAKDKGNDLVGHVSYTRCMNEHCLAR